MSFKDRPFEQRLSQMGDLAEAKFEETYPRNFIRFGIDRPPLQVQKLPERIRHAPDYLTSTSFVECQGFGRDQTFKLKWVKLNCLLFWSSLFPVLVFVLDSHNDRHRLIPLEDLTRLIDGGKATFGYFPEPKGYFAIKAEDIFDA